MAFQGKLVAGVGKALRLYDMGKKKLLRKVETKVCSSRLLWWTRVSDHFFLELWLYYCHSQYAGVEDNRR